MVHKALCVSGLFPCPVETRPLPFHLEITKETMKEMPQQVPEQAKVTFYDVAAYFSDEDWKRLQECQQELYKNVMKEIHQVLVSLGYEIVNPNTLVRIIKRKEILNFQAPERTSVNESTLPCRPAVHPDIFLRLKQEEEPSCREWPYFEELQICNRALKDETITNPEVSHRTKTEENVNLQEPQDTEAIANQDYFSTDETITNPEVSHRTKTEENVNLQDPQETQALTNQDYFSTGYPFLKPDVCWKKEDSKAFLVGHHDEERRTSPSSGYEVISFTIKEEEDSYPLDHHVLEKIEIVNSPTGVGAMERKRKTGNSIQCNKKETQCKAPSEKANKKMPPSSKKETSSKDQIKLESHLEWGNKTTIEHGSGSSNSPHFTLRQDALNGDGVEKPECKMKPMDSDRFTFQRNSEQKRPPYTCSECEKSFSLKGNLTTHMRTHTREKPYQCAECEKSFSLKRNLSRHQRIHKEEKDRPYHCTECEKSFSQKDNLVIHTRTHTGERPFQCTECEKRFTVKANLITHQRLHSGERPYQCTECEKSFSQKDHLTGHKAKHTGVRPYQCTRCEKSFSFKGSLIRHQSAHRS